MFIRVKAIAFAATVVAACCVASPALAQSMQDAKTCDNVNAPAAQIVRACSLFLRTRKLPNGRTLTGKVLANTLSRRGLAYATMAENERASADFDEAVQVAPREPLTRVLRGTNYMRVNDFERAMDDYNEAIRINTKFALAYQNRANLYMVQREYDRALADYNRAVQLNAKDAYAYQGRGRYYTVMGDTARARADFKKAIDLQPSAAATLREDAEQAETWIRYLKDIQDEGDYANWSRPPLDGYRSAR